MTAFTAPPEITTEAHSTHDTSELPRKAMFTRVMRDEDGNMATFDQDWLCEGVYDKAGTLLHRNSGVTYFMRGECLVIQG
jgi:uncharacterized phage protein gp47/JayE